jgi:hypothetical protein
MKFCLYDTKYERIILVAKNLTMAFSQKEKFALSNEVSIFPLLSKEEYMLYPHSFRGIVNGQSYLLFEVPGGLEHKYDRVIVQDE